MFLSKSETADGIINLGGNYPAWTYLSFRDPEYDMRVRSCCHMTFYLVNLNTILYPFLTGVGNKITYL
jgi:hypothetical protein